MPATATDRLVGLTTSTAVKPACVVATSFNITLAGLQTVGAVVLADGDRVLVRAQTDATKNGIYTASTSDWQRALDFDGARDVVRGTLVLINSDTNLCYRLTTPDPIIIGNSALIFDVVGTALTQAGIGAAFYPQNSAEIAAGVTPASYLYLPYDIRRYGAARANTSAQNLTALNTAISVASASVGAALLSGVVITIPADCHYGYNFQNQSTWPQINSGTIPILVIDYSQGDTYDNYPTRYDGTQVREFIYTPQTTSSGQHNGNGKVLYSNWHPYLLISNTEVNANPTANALDNLRASIFLGSGTNYGTWRLGQGTLAGAGLVPSQLLNFNIAMYAATQVVNVAVGYSAGATSAVLAAPWAGATQRMAAQFTNTPGNDIRGVLFTNGSTAVTWTTPLTNNSSGDGHLTIGIVAGGGGNPLIVDFAAAGNCYFNTGSNGSTANYHFKQPVTDFNVAMWESLTTVCDHVLRNSTGSAADWIVRNNNGTYELVFPAISVTPLMAINGAAKTTQMSGAFYPATPVGGPQSNSAMYGGTGAPNNANGNNGDYYFRSDTPGTGNQRIYVKSAGAWVGIV